MPKLRILFGIILSSTVAAQNLAEFSTSMDFDEFSVVIRHLQPLDSDLSNEISSAIAQFRDETGIGEAYRYEFKSVPGYITFEREDSLSFEVFVLTSREVKSKIEAAYEDASREMEI